MNDDRAPPPTTSRPEGEGSGVLELLSGRLIRVGLDLVKPLSVRAYNDVVAPDHRLPDLGREDALAVVIGNSRALWPAFLDDLRRRPSALEERDPLDAFVMEHVGAAVRALHVQSEVRYSHEPPPRRVAMQTLAEVAGLAWRSPAFLSVHPVYGPWIGLRAAVVVDEDAPAQRATPALRACHACEGACAPAAERALSVGQAFDDDWRRWLAVRDACPLGRTHRYDDDQTLYHYTKDRAVLARLIRSAARPPR